MSKTQPKINIAIKYCGGCNPDFDRVAAVADMLDRLADVVAVVPADDDRLDMLPESEGTVRTWLQNEVWKEIMNESKNTLYKLKA